MPAECQLIFAAASRPSERFTFFVVVGLASVFPQPPKHGARKSALLNGNRHGRLPNPRAVGLRGDDNVPISDR